MSQKSKLTQHYSISQLELMAAMPRRTIHFYVKEGLIPPPEGLGRSARYTNDHYLRLVLIRRLKSTTHLRLEGIREIIEPMATYELQEQLDSLEAGTSPTSTPAPSTAPPMAERRPSSFKTMMADAADNIGVRELSRADYAMERNALIDDLSTREVFADESVERRILDDYTKDWEASREETLDLSGFAEGAPDPEEYLAAAIKRDASPESTDTDITAYKSRQPYTDMHNADTWKRVRVTNDLEIHFRPGATSYSAGRSQPGATSYSAGRSQPGGDRRFEERLRRLVAIARKIFSK